MLQLIAVPHQLGFQFEIQAMKLHHQNVREVDLQRPNIRVIELIENGHTEAIFGDRRDPTFEIGIVIRHHDHDHLLASLRLLG